MLRDFPRCCAAAYWDGDLVKDNVHTMISRVAGLDRSVFVFHPKGDDEVVKALADNKFSYAGEWGKHHVFVLSH